MAKEKEVSPEVLKQVREDVQEAFRMLARAYEIPITESDLPRVMAGDFSASSYDFHNKKVSIDSKDIGSGRVYFGEASHALRDLVQNRLGISHDHQDKRIQEFYDRAGQTLGRQLAQGTRLAPIFANKQPLDYLDPEWRKKRAVSLNKLRKIKQSSRAVRGSHAKFGGLTKENIEELRRLSQEYGKGIIGDEEAIKRADDLFTSYSEALKGNSITKSNLKGAIDYLRSLRILGEDLRSAQDMPYEFRKTYFKEALEHAVLMAEAHSDSMEISNLLFDLDVFSAGLNHKEHQKPYEFAQVYSADELLQLKGLYSMPDAEVRSSLFNRRRVLAERERKKENLKSLEGKLAGITAVASLIGAIFFVSPHLTGSAISTYSQSKDFTGIVLFLIGLIGALLFLRNR